MHAIQTLTKFPEEFHKITPPARASILLVLTVALLFICSASGFYSIRESAIEARMTQSKSLVEAAQNTTWFYYNQFMNGKMNEADAKSAAYSVLNSMHYDNDNYIFAYTHDNSKEYILVVNRVRPDLIGKNRYDAISPDGVYYVQAGVNVAKAGGGFYSYQWNAGGTTTISRPKLSYAADFQPWHLMIGTGTYVDDIFTSFWNNINWLGTICALCIIFGSSVLTWMLSYRRKIDGGPVNRSY